MKAYLFLTLSFFTATLMAQETEGAVEFLDAEMEVFFNLDSQIEELASGFEWSEGPVWVPKLNGLLFSDVPENKVFLWSPKDGLKVFLDPSGFTVYAKSNAQNAPTAKRLKEPGSNGLALDAEGNLVLCQHGDRRVAKLIGWESAQPQYKTLVDRFENKRFNSPNDLVFAKNGDLYFTDPPYGLNKQDQDERKELPHNGVYKLTANGKLSLVTKALSRPNGIGLSLDEKTLYIGNSDAANSIILAVDLSVTPHTTRVFFDGNTLSKSRRGLFDGLKVHSSGVIFATGPGGVLVIDEQGNHLGTIRTNSATANCGFDPKEEYLYMTSDAYLTRIKLN